MSIEKNKSIIFVSPGYHPTIGGTEKQVQLLAENAATLGWDATVLTLAVSGQPAQEHVNGVFVHRVQSPLIKNHFTAALCWGTCWLLWRKRKSNPLLFMAMLNTPTLLMLPVASLLGLKCVIRPSAGGGDGNLDKLSRSKMGRFKVMWLRFLNPRILCINSQIYDEYKKVGISSNHLHSLPNGVAVQNYVPVPSENKPVLKIQKSLDGNTPLFLFVGRLDAVKNLETALKALIRLAKKGLVLNVLLVGDGQHRAELEKLVHREQGDNVVRFEGFQSPTQVYYQLADVFFLPSFREGLSNSLLEALASGVPVLASDIPANRDVLNSSGAGLLCAPTDVDAWEKAIEQLLLSAENLKLMSEKARLLAEQRYSTKILTQRVIEILESL